MIVTFPGAVTAKIKKVGGKGQSLIRMTQLGLPVPPGFILCVEFFEDWMQAIKSQRQWQNFILAAPDDKAAFCDALKAVANEISFSAEQSASLDHALAGFASNEIFAVRSSSPAEDLESSSFAGGYESVLGVQRESVYNAVRHVFASCFDQRVVSYKLKHGFPIDDPAIAVIVQKQLNSTVSGVAFSINPINNDYDEAVFNANFGLGESVVGGSCTPDTIIIDKVSMRVKEKRLGAKEERSLLSQDGGTRRVKTESDGGFSISDGQVISLTRYVKTLEEVFRKPVDIEWAVENDNEYILQARPITSYLPLPPSVVTVPGAPRNLYFDVTLAVQALEKPISPMSTSVLRRLLSRFSKKILGMSLIGDLDHSLIFPSDGRLYAVISNLVHVFGARKLSSLIAVIDPLSARCLENIDAREYADRCLFTTNLLMHFSAAIAFNAPKVLYARAFPEKVHATAQREIALLRKLVRRSASDNGNVIAAAERIFDATEQVVANHVLPLVIASRWALSRLQGTGRRAGIKEELLHKLELAMPNNLTVDMGLDLYDLAAYLPDGIRRDTDIAQQSLPMEFISRWNKFLISYGHRTARELDIAEPRYREKPGQLIEQMIALKNAAGGNHDPLSRYAENRAERNDAYNEILNLLRDREDVHRRFRRLYNTWQTLGGYRETPKFCFILGIDALRSRLLNEGVKLVRQGKLDRVERIFDLTLEDLEQFRKKGQIDLMELCAKNRKYADQMARYPRLPTLIDSRGRIIRPPAPVPGEREVAGTPISSGIARGRIKVLAEPNEKPLLVGEVLVARATDPGWTPLFANASALILEVGGLLQHGALVAREYGLPCVGGIAGATNIWRDGTLVEVDGSAGIVKVIESADD